MSAVRWSYEGECWIAWLGLVIAGRVHQVDRSVWQAWALGRGDCRFEGLTRAQRWVERQVDPRRQDA